MLRNVVHKFLENWENRRFQQMYKYVQKTWKRNHSYEIFVDKYKNVKLAGFRVFEIEEKSDILAKATFEVSITSDLRSKKDPKIRVLEMNIIKEKESFLPHPDGEWGVNPSSVWRKGHVEKTD